MSDDARFWAARAEIPNGYIALMGAGVQVMGLSGPKAPVKDNNFGGWEPMKRPREDSLVEWQGHDVAKLTLEIMFDGMVPNLSLGELPQGQEGFQTNIEPQIHLLEHLTEKVDGTDSPPIVWALGKIIPVHDARYWVINNITTQGDQVKRADGATIRETYVVELLEYISFDLIKGKKSSAKKKKNSGKRKAVHTRQKKGHYVTKEGDTLRKVAKKELGSAARWGEIASLNGIRDGNSVRPGQKLKMP